MRTITLEEHFAFPAFVERHGRFLATFGPVVEKLCDIGEGRIAEMDEAGIDVQVLSLTTPGVEQLDPEEAVAMAREANDRLAEAVHRHPDRLAGFATLPTPAPEAAAEELERMVREHGFKGAVINGHSRGRYLDDRFFAPILERAQALQAPIYLHPTPPPQAVIDASYGGFSSDLTALLSAGAWGWHAETAVHVLRMVVGGVFDRFPGLQLVVGHMGEMLPSMLPRFEMNLPAKRIGLEREVSSCLRENVSYTFSGFNWTSVFLELLLQMGVDRIMFSADHPYRSMAAARGFLDRLPVSPADRERIAHGNAERLLGL